MVKCRCTHLSGSSYGALYSIDFYSYKQEAPMEPIELRFLLAIDKFFRQNHQFIFWN